MKSYFVGIDIGTSGTKAVMIDQFGVIISESMREYGVISPNPAWAEQWPGTWETAVYETCKAVTRSTGVDPSKIKGVCISGLFAGSGVPLDEDMNVVRPAIIWMDRRAQIEAEFVERTIGNETLFARTGNRNDAYFGYAKILWIKNHEKENWGRIKLFLPSNSYIVYKITGDIAIDYTAAANIGGIYDLNSSGWDYELMDAMGIPRHMMPDTFKYPEDIVGFVTSEAAQKLGIPEGTPVCAGCTDCLASTLAAGLYKDGEQAAVIGTSINWGLLHKGLNKDEKLVSMPFIRKEEMLFYTYGGATSAGALPAWFRNNLAMYQSGPDHLKEIRFQDMDSDAKDISPGSDGLIVLPYFMGERSPIWDANAKGTIFGLSLHHNFNHIYRALLESVAYSLRHIMESAVGLRKENQCVITGGITKSAIWGQIIADVTGCNILYTRSEKQAPFGDAFIAGVATGYIPGYSLLDELVHHEVTLFPSEQNFRIYNDYFKQYKNLYASLIKNMEQLNKSGNIYAC